MPSVQSYTFKKNIFFILFLENSSMWDLISKKLSKKHRVVCIDLLGHGATENHGYIHTMQEQAEMVVAVLKHLRLRKYIIVGHSMGGYIALEVSKIFSKNMNYLMKNLRLCEKL